jgi:hypothetical protein
MGTFIGTSTGIGSSSNDIISRRNPSILDQGPLIYMDSVGVVIPTMYLSFRLADGVESRDINIYFYVDGSLSFNIPVQPGITQLWEFPPNGEYYCVLNVDIDGEVYSFPSNTLIV